MKRVLIVGAGLFGATLAHLLTSRNYAVTIVEKKSVPGGTVRTECVKDIHIHKYGAHIFNTNDEDIWKFVNKFDKFEPFINSPIAVNHGALYNMPFNMNTFTKLWSSVHTPAEAKAKIQSQCREYNHTPENLEEHILSTVGADIYEKLIRDYTEKQWGCKCTALPPSIMKRVPLRFTFDNNYYSNKYQGIPINGYTKLIENMLLGSNVFYNVDGKSFVKQHKDDYDFIVYTGSIDDYYDNAFGKLPYRSLYFTTQMLSPEDTQGVAVMNYTDKTVEYTRSIEHNLFVGRKDVVIVSHEYPIACDEFNEPIYPIPTNENIELYKKYKALNDKIYFAGRLGSYQYTNMSDTVNNAIHLYKEIINYEDENN